MKTPLDMNKLKDDLIRDEGRVDEIYIDSLGHKTFGIGHLVTEVDNEYNYPVGTEVDSDRVSECFEDDLDSAVLDAAELYGCELWWSLDGEIQSILVNMIFNLGRTRLKGFRRMNIAISEGDWKEAAKEGRDSRWYFQVGNRAERLMTRMENFSE